MPHIDRTRRLADKVAIVTGGGAEPGDIGIGRAISLLLAEEKAAVCCVDLDLGRAAETVSMIEQAGGRAIAIAGDVSNADCCRSIVDEAMARFGRLDILVNNVGISTPVALDVRDEAQWQRVFDVNLKSAFLMSACAVPLMTACGGGAIVNISSLAAIRAHGSVGYGVAKAAMQHLAREIAVAHGKDGIRANTVAPGHVMTPHANAHPEQARLRDVRRRIGPMEVEGDAWDVAMAVAFLASDEARFITGVILPVDGGVTETGPLSAHIRMMAGDASG